MLERVLRCKHRDVASRWLRLLRAPVLVGLPPLFSLAGGLEDASELLTAPAAVPKYDGALVRSERFMSGTQQRNAQLMMSKTATVI